MSAGFDLYGPALPNYPVILSVPHAGRHYPENLAETCRFTPDRLRLLEDRHADLLAEHCWERGLTGLVARTPRAWIDLNRAEHDVDPGMLSAPLSATPAMLSAKARGGLGLIPRRTPQLGELWHRRLDPADVHRRIAQDYRPYHTQLAAALAAARARFGAALLIDLHSMPPLADTPLNPAPTIVIGDRFGRSAAGFLTDMAGQIARKGGHRVAFNAPYAGGHILEAHARPESQIHALQIEIDRRLYLDADLINTGPGLGGIRALVLDLCQTLGAALIDSALPRAAE
jgi:N-formylglutamate amidohydrolase